MSYRINRSLLGGVLSLTFSASVFASGFQNNESNVSHLGTAFSGTAASAYDASTAFLNPAGMTQLNKHQFMMAGTYIHGDFDYKFTSGTDPAGTALAVDSTHRDNDDLAVPAVIPAIHYTKPLNDRMGFGFSITSPFGLATEYDDDAIQRYLATRSKLLTVDLNPSVAYQVAPWVSIGGGVSAQYLRANLDSMLRGLGTDFESKSIADSWGYGWNAGVMLRFNQEKTRVGLSYRSKVHHELSGDTKFDGTPGALSAFFAKQKVKGEITLPEVITASFFHNINSWDLLADVAYTNWSRFSALQLNFSPGFSTPTTVTSSTTPQHYEDTWRYSAGVGYHVNDNWMVKAGYYFEQSPVQKRFRTSRLPDSDRHGVALGLQYATNSKRFVFDAGYLYIMFDDNIPVNEVGPLANGNAVANPTINGKYDGRAHLFGLQGVWNF